MDFQRVCHKRIIFDFENLFMTTDECYDTILEIVI